MTSPTYPFNPDYAVPPGWVLEEDIEVLKISQEEFAYRCGYSPDVIREIIAGRGRIEPQIATVLERETGLNETVWLNMETSYRSKLVELGENAELSEWAKKFPVEELVERGNISKHSLEADKLARMFSFLDVWSVGYFQDKYGAVSVACRRLPGFQSSPQELAAWLRLGEIEAEQAGCADYDKAMFERVLRQIRALTPLDSTQGLAEARNLCQQCGVALCFVKPFRGMALSGAAWWRVAPRKPVIQLSAQHNTDDHLWFGLFHEAAHILLHSKKRVFIDAIRSKSVDGECGEREAELEADRWARDFLIPRADWDGFCGSFLGGAAEVRAFAGEQGISPGIVVGRLQREGLLPWDRLNALKRRLEWAEPPP